MKLQQLLTVTAATVPLGSALSIQDVIGNLKDLEPEYNAQNPLDDALKSSSIPEVEDIDINRYINTDDVDTWIKDFFSQSIDDILTSVLADPIDVNIDIPINANLDPHYPGTSDKTVYQLISESKYTTILAKIIKEDSELVDYLNSTDRGKFTFFAPTNHTFAKIPHHRHRHREKDDDGDGDDDDHRRIPKELIRALLRYHSSPEVLSATKLFHSQTIPSALEDALLGTTDNDNDKQGLPQRLTVRRGFRGLTLNFYSHIVAADIAASNGLIHGIDSILLPPPPTLLLLDILPTKFSTFNLALYKTNLTTYLNTTSSNTRKSKGHTIFVPSNFAFQRLGLRINAFLFSPPGLKYLRALLKYHIVPDRTLYSDVLYTDKGEIKPFGVKGFTHLDLPTLLGDERKIVVDVAHFGPYASFKINGWQRVAFADALAKDGNLHVVDHVLIPPRRLGDAVPGDWSEEEEEELAVEDLMERLRPWVEEDEEEAVAVAADDEIAVRATEL